MAKRYIHNPTADLMMVGGVLIQPGEGREVDEQFLPPEHRPEPVSEEAAAPAPDANLVELLAGPVKAIVPQLPEFGDDTLKALANLEQASNKPRKSLVSAIDQLLLDRAAARGAPPLT